MKTTRLFLLSTLVLPLTLAGCDKDVTDTGSENADADTDTGDGDPGEEGETDPGPVDSDEDGLTDEEEAMYGTDPNKKDTDGDNYWDSWEIIEGTDPLDLSSRIYTGFWPYNPAKDDLEQGSWANTSTNVGELFPRDSFLDQHGDMVDLYDFANFVSPITGEVSYFIFDISAQWCGPCHNVANWIAHNDSQDNAWIEETYPTVRQKVEEYRIWWVTFIAEANDGSAPTLSDSQSWYSVHTDSKIPVLVDDAQDVRNNYLGPAFPHFFLLDPEMRIEFFPPQSGGTNEDPYPAVGLVDKYL